MAVLTKNPSRNIPDSNIVLADFLTGRVPTGHQEDYLLALETALADFNPVTVAPFRYPQLHAPADVPTIERGNRIGRYLATFRVSMRYLNAPTPTLLIFHGPEFRDFIAFAAAALMRRRRGQGRGVFVMRRKAWAIVGRRGLKARLLDAVIKWMAPSRFFYMLSDSRSVMDYWLGCTGVDGPILSIPTRRPVETVTRKPEDSVVIGLLGGFRLEKGASLYSAVIAMALGESSTEVDCQISENAAESEEIALMRSLTNKWQGNPRVRFHCGHLDATAFARLLYSVDIVVLPYDAESYGPGTSGILFEALAAGRIVAITRIDWAVQEYADHPNILWLEDRNSDTIKAALKNATERVVTARKTGGLSVPDTDQFKQTWCAALKDAARD
ncbi:MAG: hypothetical protein COA65_06875 [Rhodospirillaceae bacterium]|nr:MAG: hypothetical protein COA65_06875 [Rhodospirillaceae bacterium]